MHRCHRNHEHYRAIDVDRPMCDKMRAQAGTRTTVTQDTTALRAFLLWGQQNGYFTVAQAELLPEGAAQPAPRCWARRCASAGAGPAASASTRRTSATRTSLPRPGDRAAR
jgi:hypothetical protein